MHIPEVIYDCEPTLNDLDVARFCKTGFLIYEGIVSDEINQRTQEFLDEHPSGEPTEILVEDWFVDGVLKNPQAAGAVRSLLGKDFKLPTFMSNHRKPCPEKVVCAWHRDGGGMVTHQVHNLQVFYYPQDTPKEMGPTQLIPGSHFIAGSRRFMKHIGGVQKAVSTASAAGSIFITHYPVLHRKTTATGTGIRNMLKYNYHRRSAPTRDWVMDPDIDPAALDFRPEVLDGIRVGALQEIHWSAINPARMYTWLCGLGEDFEFRGGHSWPVCLDEYPGTPYEGFPSELLSNPG